MNVIMEVIQARKKCKVTKKKLDYSYNAFKTYPGELMKLYNLLLEAEVTMDTLEGAKPIACMPTTSPSFASPSTPTISLVPTIGITKNCDFPSSK